MQIEGLKGRRHSVAGNVGSVTLADAPDEEIYEQTFCEVAFCCERGGDGFGGARRGEGEKGGLKQSDVFRTTNIWDVHLSFKAEQWEAMEPKEGERPEPPPGTRGFSLRGAEGGRNG